MGELLGIPHSAVSDYEKGKRIPSLSLLDKLSTETGFLPAFFSRRIDDPFLDVECSFRHKRSTIARQKDQVRAQATLLGMIVSSLKEFLNFPTLNVPHMPASNVSEIDKAAEECRKHWRLDLDAPIMQVGRVLERAGVVIIAGAVDTKKIDAFSRWGRNPIVFMNRGAGTHPSRWNFDLAHECAHLVLHRDIPTGSGLTEQEADRFASAFLLPERGFSREFRVRPFSWQHLFELKQRWQVSLAAIVRRARDLMLIDEGTYKRAFQQMSYRRWLTKGEPFEPIFQEPELFMSAVKALGTQLEKTVPELCRELCLSEEVFTQITGIPIPPSHRNADVLHFAK
jgi:Zn-dependent peptidase ImmA (M78 family)